MRKKYEMIFLIAAMMLIGCSAKKAELDRDKGKLGPENTYTLNVKADNMIVPQKRSADSSIDLSNYDNILKRATEIVYGEVESIENYNGAGGTAWVREHVKVIESYKGQLSEGETINVIQQTGFISGHDFIDSFVPEERDSVRDGLLGSVSDEDLDKLILDQTDGIPLDNKGDRIVFCLWKSSQSTNDAVYYEPVGDWAGKQVDMGNGKFAQYYPEIFGDEKSDEVNYEMRSSEEMKALLKIK